MRIWANLAKARRELIDSKALADDPFLNRFWHHHIFWFCSFVRIAAATEARRLCWAVYMRYCRMLDRLLGGNREDKFCEWLMKRAERYEARAHKVKAQLEARHRIHEQYIAAIEQRQKELEEEMRALMHGNFVTRDPKTYN